MPSAIQACRGNAPNDCTPSLALSNMKTFMTPDAPYRSAARTCRIHNRMFIVCLRPVSTSDRLRFMAMMTHNVTVGNGTLGSVAGTVDVSYRYTPPFTGGITADASLTINDQGDKASSNIGITSNAVSFQGRRVVTYNLAPSSPYVTTLRVRNGSDGGEIDVTGTSSAAPLTIATGAGLNIVNIFASASTVNVNGSDGHDFVYVGDGLLTPIKGRVNVTNSQGSTNLTIDDSSDTTGRSSTITSNSVASGGGPIVSYSAKISELSIYAVSGWDFYDAASVSSSTPINLYIDPNDVVYGPSKNKIHIIY